MKKTQILEIFIDAYPIKRRRMLRIKSVPRYNSYQILRTIVELCDIGFISRNSQIYHFIYTCANYTY